MLISQHERFPDPAHLDFCKFFYANIFCTQSVCIYPYVHVRNSCKLQKYKNCKNLNGHRFLYSKPIARRGSHWTEAHYLYIILLYHKLARSPRFCARIRIIIRFDLYLRVPVYIMYGGGGVFIGSVSRCCEVCSRRFVVSL